MLKSIRRKIFNYTIFVLILSLTAISIFAELKREGITDDKVISVEPVITEKALPVIARIEKKQFIPDKPSVFRLGNEVLLSNLSVLKGRRVGLVTNNTGILSDGRFFLDELIRAKVNVVTLFSPEHGFRGNENYISRDPVTDLPIVALYGAKEKISSSDMDSVDVLIYDIQDVGARFYTYTSTLYYLLESAGENKKAVIVCDRPLMLNPDYVDGFMLDTNFRSFVGTVSVPVTYGMTSGELASYLNNMIFNNSVDLTVSKMDNYSRAADYSKLGLKWVKPSPSMFSPETALLYPATCFLEGTNVSEGRGTDKPFEYAGAPWINSEQLADSLNRLGIPGVRFEPAVFKPAEKISAYDPKFFGENCNGVYINVTDKKNFEPVKAGIALLVMLYNTYPQFEFTSNNYIDKLAGTDRLRKQITGGKTYNEIIRSYEKELMDFESVRFKYLLYN